MQPETGSPGGAADRAADRAANRTAAAATPLDHAAASSDWLAEAQSLTLAVTGLAGWHATLPTGEVRWTPELEVLLGVAGSSTPAARDAVGALVEPILAALRDPAAPWADLDLDHPVTLADGTPRTLRVHARVVHRDGVAVGVVGLVSGADSRSAATELADLAERYRLLVDLSPDAIIVHQAGEVVYANDAVVGITGLARSTDLLGRNVNEFVHPDDRAAMIERIRTMPAAGMSAAATEVRFVGVNGALRYGELVSVRTTWQGAPAFQVIVRDVTERHEHAARLAWQAFHDHLTGLPNRAAVLDHVDARLGGVRPGQHLALLFVDLDRFKLVNDALGHEVGDLVLRGVADRLRESVGADSFVGRLAGDEFVVVCDTAGPSDARAHAQRLADALAQPLDVAGRTIVPVASIGLATVDLSAGRGSGTTTALELLRDADVAMYHAKERGRARVEMFDAALRDKAVRRQEAEQDLRAALAASGPLLSGELQVVYQPVFALNTGSPDPVLTGVEALVRWHHPRRGEIAPDEFVSIAEETGLIAELGEKVLRTACRQAAAWRELGGRLHGLRISVNISTSQLTDPRFVGQVDAVLAETGLSADALMLEVTETTLMRDTRASAEVMRRLDRLGVQLTIDDFGTGYSSLAYLKRFPVRELKIDRSFVAGLTTDAGDAAIVASIIGLAHTLGLGVVAEGVEDAAQLAALRGLRCDAVQGYLLGRPQPADRIRLQ